MCMSKYHVQSRTNITFVETSEAQKVVLGVITQPVKFAKVKNSSSQTFQCLNDLYMIIKAST